MTPFEDELSLKIPAYLRGDLSEAEIMEIESYAEDNAEFSADIEFQRQLKSAVKDSDEGFVPGELGWAKLSKAMKEESPSHAALHLPDTIAANDSAKAPKFWRYAAAILAVAVVGQAGVIGVMGSSDKNEPQYVTVSEMASVENAVKIGFKDDVTLGALTTTLSELDGSIVSGPSALGLYAVSFESSETCARAVAALRTNAVIVETISRCN